MEGHTYDSLDRENVFFPRPQTRHMNKKYPSKLPTPASGRGGLKPLGPINLKNTWNPEYQECWKSKGKKGGKKKKERSYLIPYLISLSRIVSRAILPENVCLLSCNYIRLLVKFDGKVFLFLAWTLLEKYTFLIYLISFLKIFENKSWYKNNTLSYKKVFFSRIFNYEDNQQSHLC